jgi:DNA or RNA helicases of superfamily II
MAASRRIYEYSYRKEGVNVCYFIETYDNLRYPIDRNESIGLRKAQIGAIHAIGSNDAFNKKVAAIVVMPTGSGKTAVLMMAPYVTQRRKVLIVTPSIMVRGQIYKDFSNLHTLKKIHVFHEEVVPPRTYELKNKFSEELRDDILSADVVVATPQVALSLSENDIKTSFDYIIIDEAHHVPAQTWQSILNNMEHAAAILFTATPFRMDRKEIRGDNIYTYPLSLAYRDGIFGEVTYIPIEEAPEKDKLIALEAERVLLNDREQGFDHYVMVRTDTKDSAKALEKLYNNVTHLRLKRIDSSTTYNTVERSIDSLKLKEIDGLICVDMLGEGFDFPNLKIAAVHAPHKSLASTLQFIGRFARTNADNIGKAKFIAMNDNGLVIENYRLFASDAVWQEMIIDMSERKIHVEESVKNNLKKYSRRTDIAESSDDTISLHNIRPNCHAKVFKISGFNIEGVFPTSCGVEDNIYRNYSDNTVIGLAEIKTGPIWLDGDQVVDIQNLLYLVHYQANTSLLFIYSQNKTEANYKEIAEGFCAKYEKIPRNEMHRVLGKMKDYQFFNTGMQNRYSEDGESYRIYAGSNTASSIDETTGKMRSAGHAFCKANKNDVPITIGYSSGSKIWSSSYFQIPEFVEWCNECGSKIADEGIVVKTQTNYDLLPIPKRLRNYPGSVFFCFFSDKTYLSPPTIYLGGELTDYVLTDVVVKIDDVKEKLLEFTASIDGAEEHLSCDVDGEYKSDLNKIFIKDGRTKVSLVEYLNDNPLQFKTTDDTLIVGNEICTGNPEAIAFSADNIDVIDWEAYKTNIKNECGNTTKKGKSIHAAMLDMFDTDISFQHIIYDHGSGEIADYITISEKEFSIEVILYHVKAMSAQNFNSGVNDIYEVTQQAVKSTIWLKSKSALLQKLVERRKGGRCILHKGDFEQLKRLLRTNKYFAAKMVIVQPSISKSIAMPSKYQEVLASTKFYIDHSGRVKDLRIWGSK